MADSTDAQVERKEDFGSGKTGDIKRWLTELRLAKKGKRKRWLAQYHKIVQRYRDENPSSSTAGDESADGEIVIQPGINLLWANVRTTAPAIYAKAPKPIVERRHKDESVVARAACLILQRSLSYQMRCKFDQFHAMMKACRLDFQLGAWCQAVVRYQRMNGNYAAGGSEGDKAGGYSELTLPIKAPAPDGIEAWPNMVSEEICFDYIHPDDFLCSSARMWPEVCWTAFRAHLTREQVEQTEIFGDEKRRKDLSTKLPFTSKPDNMGKDEAEKDENGAFMRVAVWAIWDRNERKIIYVCEDYTDEVIAIAPDPSSLDGFFPCPPPAMGTRTNNSIWPVPDYMEYGGQAREVDELTKRLDAVLESIKVVGAYDAAVDELKTALDGGYENKMIGVKNWQEFSEKGGFEGSVDFMPIENFAKVLDILVNARTVAKQDADMMSGVFDLMRGAGDAREKLGTQKLKAGYTEQRNSEPKDTMANFARDTLAIAGEMIAEHFSPASLWQMSDFGTWYKGQERGLRSKKTPQLPPMGSNSPAPLPGAPGGPGMPPAGNVVPFAPPGGAPPIPQGGGMLPPPQPAASAPGMPAGPAPGPMPGAPAGPMMPPGGAPAAPGAAPMPPAPMPQPEIPTAQEVFLQAVELLRNEKLRGFVITIETDSTIEPDAAMEQQRRTQLLETMSVFMEKALMLGAQVPESVPLIAQMLLFAVRGFGASRELETAFEVFLDRMTEKAANPPPPKPTPDEIKAKAEQQKMEAEAAQEEKRQAFELKKMEVEIELERQKHALDMERMQMELRVMEQKMQLMAEEGRMKLQLQQQKNQMDLEATENKNAMAERQMVREDTMAERTAAREDEFASRSMERQEQHETKMMETKEQQAAKPKPAGGSKK